MVSSAANVRPNMVDTTFSVDQLANRFASIGLSIDDLVVLSGNRSSERLERTQLISFFPFAINVD